MSPESKYSKKPFSVTYFRYMATSIFYQNFDFFAKFEGEDFCSKIVFLALESALNLDSCRDLLS
jgi:hypothetical protein